jgi:hypothetical protein
MGLPARLNWTPRKFTLCPLTKAEDHRRSDDDRAKKAHDDLIAAAFRAQADALEIEALAKRRLADEYDAAQERDEVSTGRNGPAAGVLNGNAKATAKEVGLSRKEIHEARQIRDAEKRDPGVVRRNEEELNTPHLTVFGFLGSLDLTGKLVRPR